MPKIDSDQAIIKKSRAMDRLPNLFSDPKFSNIQVRPDGRS